MMFYDLLKKCVSLFFNLLNRLLGGKLPPFGSAGVVVEDHDRYLVVQLPGNRVVFPGGFMAWNEHPREAAEREGEEETGLVLRAEGLIGHYSQISNHWSNLSNISFVYAATPIGGKLRNNIEGRPLWLHESELRTRIHGQTLTILEDYLRYRANQPTQNNQTPPTRLILVS